MRITELFTAQSIALDEALENQEQILSRLVELQATHGNITDKDAYKKALYAREAEGSTYVDDGIHKPEELIKKIVHGEVPVYHAEGGAQAADDASGKDSVGRTLYKNLMNGVSHMLPFVVGGGIMIALAFLLDDYTIDPSNFGMNTPVAAFFKTVGGAAFGYMLPILSAFIAMSIADRPGLAAVMVGGMVPPIAIALSTTFCPKKWTADERRNGIVNYVMGLCFVTEGAIPYAAADPLRILPSCVAGAAVAGALSMTFGCALRAPHGGIFVFPVVDHAVLYCVALAVGSVLGAVILSLLKKNRTDAE